jgi:hypothetical protein
MAGTVVSFVLWTAGAGCEELCSHHKAPGVCTGVPGPHTRNAGRVAHPGGCCACQKLQTADGCCCASLLFLCLEGHVCCKAFIGCLGYSSDVLGLFDSISLDACDTAVTC